MQRLKNYRVVIHLKNHNLCIILSFLLVSQRRIKCVFYSGGRRPAPSEDRPAPPLPRAGASNHVRVRYDHCESEPA